MSSQLRKTVDLATKPKRAAPKAKYIDPIIQGTFSQDGALQDIVRSLSVRMKDPNTTVVFKSLIVLHTMLRAGSLEQTYSYLASSSLSLTLSSHDAPNISAYGHYLAARIKSYTNLKRDVIRDKSDRRAGNRLRNLPVEQGLLRETREVQRMIAALVESKFYTDDIDDEVSMTALRFLVKDLLVLFTAVNEGVINVLEHYFEMSHPDATTALKIYKTFCRDTEKVVAYLGIAKKLSNVTHITIPNLKHAPVSLVSSLEEYLNDPNFAANREEYKENKRIADGGAPRTTPKPSTASSSAPSASTSTAGANPSASAPTASFTDFFESIEQSQTSMFDPSTVNAPQFFPQQTGFNPFLQPQMTGMPFQPQPTGMMPFGGVSAPMNPFGQPQFLQNQPTGFQPQFALQGQPTGFIQPQATGANPFRQSMMPTGAGGPFGVGGPFGQQQQPPPLPFSSGPFQPQQQVPQQTGAPSPFAASPFGQPQQQQQQQQQPVSAPFAPPTSLAPLQTGSPFGAFSSGGQQSQPAPSSPFAPNRVASPFTSAAPPSPAPLTAQKTGARNPFAPPGTLINPPPPPAAAPSMNMMATGAYQQQQQQAAQQQQQQQQQQQAQQAQPDPFSSIFGNAPAASTPAPLQQNKTGFMGNIASEFSFDRPSSGAGGAAPAPSSPFSSLPPPVPSSSTPFTSSSFTTSPAPLTTQPTGFFSPNGVKAFQPTSTFGAKLADEFGGSNGGAIPSPSTLSSQPTGFQPSAAFSSAPPAPSLTPQRTGFVPTSSFGQSSFGTAGSGYVPPATSVAPTTTNPGQLTAQMTGFNPFRGSTLPPLNATLNGGGAASQGQGQGQGSLI